jgi:hypothetical protein
MSARLYILVDKRSDDKELVVDILPEHGASHKLLERFWNILFICQQVINCVGPAALHYDLVEDRDSVAALYFLVDGLFYWSPLFLERQVEYLLPISVERVTSEVVDRVADTVVDLERHFERFLEEEVSLVINLSLIIDLATFLRIETACNVTLPLTHALDPVNLRLRINQASAPARTHSRSGPCAVVFRLLQTSDYLLHVHQRSSNRLNWLLYDRWRRNNNFRNVKTRGLAS